MEYLDSTERSSFRVRTRISRYDSEGSLARQHEWGGSEKTFRKIEKAVEYAERLKRQIEKGGATEESYVVFEYEIEQQQIFRYVSYEEEGELRNQFRVVLVDGHGDVIPIRDGFRKKETAMDFVMGLVEPIMFEIQQQRVVSIPRWEPLTSS